jgi:hypothetical protein
LLSSQQYKRLQRCAHGRVSKVPALSDASWLTFQVPRSRGQIGCCLSKLLTIAQARNMLIVPDGQAHSHARSSCSFRSTFKLPTNRTFLFALQPSPAPEATDVLLKAEIKHARNAQLVHSFGPCDNVTNLKIEGPQLRLALSANRLALDMFCGQTIPEILHPSQGRQRRSHMLSPPVRVFGR